jgi:hypothetical protein
MTYCYCLGLQQHTRRCRHDSNCQRWAKNIYVSPNSATFRYLRQYFGRYRTLLGPPLGRAGLLTIGIPDDSPNVDIAPFDLGQYGVPVAMAGIAYVLVMSPLPGGSV